MSTEKKKRKKSNLEVILNTNKESKDGTWEYTHTPGYGWVKFEYWLPNGGWPTVTLNLTVEEFNDLVGFMKGIKPIKLKKNKK